MSRILRHRLTSRLLGALLILTFVATAPVLARTKKVAFIDDDWEPVERGREYTNDPGYENWIIDALNAQDIEFDEYEVQVQGMPPELPTLSQLSDYQLILWDCGADTVGAMGYDERMLIRAYRNLGGKVVLIGQGILNSLQNELEQSPGDPEIIDFLQNHLGVSGTTLDLQILELLPPTYVPYFMQIPPTSLDYSDLPDTDPGQVDAIIPQAGVDTILDGLLPLGGYVSVATTTYLPAPLHFQTVLPHAIESPNLRGQWLHSTMQTIGYEGDLELMDFMLGSEEFEEVLDCPPSWIGWDPGPNAMGFEAWGNAPCPEIWSMDLSIYEPECYWEIGFTHILQSVSMHSDMVIMEIGTPSNSDYVRLTTKANVGGYQYDLEFEAQDDGVVIHTDGYEGLDLAEAYRIKMSLVGTGPDLTVWIFDHLGMVVGYFQVDDFAPEFSKLRMHTVVSGMTPDGPTVGWVDDLHLDGCVTVTSAGNLPTPAADVALKVHPNPFNPSTSIDVTLPRGGAMRASVHDLTGRRVRTLTEGWRDAGRLELVWDGRDDDGRALSSGVYLVRVTGASLDRSAKLVLLK